MTTENHIIAGITGSLGHRRQLALLLDSGGTGRITDIDPATLGEAGIRALALDFDGVLSPHGASEPLPEVIAWLKHCCGTIGSGRVFILSNKPTPFRNEWFRCNFPGIRFISGTRKKPFPDGLNIIGKLSGVPLPAILMVDDRLLTGCLAALNAGARPCYIRQPYVLFSGRPLAELFFILLRSCERLFVRLINR